MREAWRPRGWILLKGESREAGSRSSFHWFGEGSGLSWRSALGRGSGQGTPLSVVLLWTSRPWLLPRPPPREPELDDRPSLPSSVGRGGVERRQLSSLPWHWTVPPRRPSGWSWRPPIATGPEVGRRELGRAGAVLTAVMVTLSAGGHGRGKAPVPHPQEPKTGSVTGSGDLCRVRWLWKGAGGKSPCLGSNLAGEPKMQLTPKFFRWKWKLFSCAFPLHSMRWERSDFPNLWGVRLT